MVALLTGSVQLATTDDASGLAVPPAPTPLVKGVSLAKTLYDSDEVLDRELDLVAATGSTWVRADFDWSVAEPKRGQYDWSYLDRLVAHTATRGLQILAVVDNTPMWARASGETNQHGAPRNPNAFARFAATAVQRYYPYGVRHWEVWNEPNLAYFWRPKPDAAAYARLLAATEQAIHAVAPGATVMSGGLSPYADGSELQIQPHAFLWTMYASGATRHLDAVAMHPYTFPSMPNDPAGSFAQLWQLQMMAPTPDTRQFVWITEFGAPTGTGPIAVTEEQQAQTLTMACAVARTQPWLGPMFVYQLRDEGTDLSNMGQNFGLLRHDWTPKSAYAAWQAC